MIQKGNEAACVGLVQLGANVKVTTVVKPDLGLSMCPQHETAGQTDGLTLTLRDVGSARTYLDIYGAIRASPTTEVTKSVLAALCTLVLSGMASATWDDFQEALTATGGDVARKDIEQAFHWVAARSHGKWNTGGSMTEREKNEWKAWTSTFKF